MSKGGGGSGWGGVGRDGLGGRQDRAADPRRRRPPLGLAVAHNRPSPPPPPPPPPLSSLLSAADTTHARRAAREPQGALPAGLDGAARPRADLRDHAHGRGLPVVQAAVAQVRHPLQAVRGEGEWGGGRRGKCGAGRGPPRSVGRPAPRERTCAASTLRITFPLSNPPPSDRTCSPSRSTTTGSCARSRRRSTSPAA